MVNIVNMDNLDNMVIPLRGFSVSLQDYLRTMLFNVYLLIRKRAVLRYIFRLLAVYVSLMANICVL
ncbi:hypothetical protein ES706_05998 [subsurface metagenome]